MGISNKKRNYIKKFAASKSVEELSVDTGLSVDQVQRILKGFGIEPISQSVPASANSPQIPNEQISFARSAFFIILSIAVLLIPLFFIPGLYDMYSLPKMVLLNVLAPLLGVVYLLEIIRSRRMAVRRGILLPLMPLILFVALMALSLIWGVNRYAGTIQLSIWICALIFCILPVQMYSGIKNIHTLCALITLAATIVALTGILQFFGFNIDMLYQAAVPGSFFGNKNFAAQFIVGALPFSIYTAWAFRQKTLGKLSSAAFFVLLFFLIITRTRGAWIASFTALVCGAAVCTVYLLHNNDLSSALRSRLSGIFKSYIMPGLICFAILLAAVYLPAFFADNAKNRQSRVKLDLREELKSITETEKGSASWRLTAWRNTLLMIQSNPLLGVGAGNWQFNYPLYARKGKVDQDFNEQRQAKRAHNDYLQFAAELGIGGLLLFLWFMGSMIFIALRLTFSRREPDWSLLGIAGLTSLLAVMGNAMFSFPLQEGLPPLFVAIVSSMLVFGYCRTRGEKTVSFPKIPVAVPVALVASSVWFVFSVTWGYRLCASDFYFLEGKRLNKGDLFEQSLYPLRKAMKLNPYNFRIYSLMGRSLNELRQYYESVTINRRALELHPYYINCMNNLGNALRGIHHVDEAIEVYNRALELFPDFAEAHNNLGIAFKEKGDTDRARAEYKKAIELDPTYEKAYNNLGNIALAENKIDEAIGYYKKAIENNPNLSDVYNNIGLAMVKKGEYKQAIDYFDTCIRANSRLPDPHHNKGTALFKLGRYDEAVAQFEKAITMNSGYLPAYNSLAELYIDQGQPLEAIAQYERMLQLNPNLRSVYQRVAEMYLDLYKKTESVQYIDKAIETIDAGIGLFPTSAALYTVRGKIYLETDQSQKAIDSFKHIVELAPDKPESYFNLGIAYHKTGDYKAALSSYHRALQMNPDFIFLYFEIGKIYEHLNENEAALKNYARFLELWQGDPSYAELARQKIRRLQAQSEQDGK